MKEMTSMQRAIWITQNIYPDSSLFNVGGYAAIDGDLNENLLVRAIREVLKHAEVLHHGYLIFNDTEDVGQGEPALLSLDLSGEADPEKPCLHWMQQDMHIPFKSPETLFRSTVIKVSDRKYFWYVKTHHLVFDGYSMALFFNKVSLVYTACQNNSDHSEALETYAYSDFVSEEQAYMDSPLYLTDKEFWLKRLKSAGGRDAFRSAMISNTRPALDSRRMSLPISRSFISRLEQAAKRYDCSVFHCFISAILIVNKIYNNDDAIIGLPVFNRGNKNHKNSFGTFVNVLPFSVAVEMSGTLAGMIIRVRNELRACYKHRRFPLYDLVEGTGSRGPVYNTTFSYQKISYAGELGNCTAAIDYIHNGQQQENLVFHLLEYSLTEDLLLSVDYSTHLFSAEVIQRMLVHISTVLESLCTSPVASLSSLNYLSEGERQVLLETFNDTASLYPRYRTLVDLFEARVRKHPEAIAVVHDGRTMTYEQLNRRSNQLAWYLRKEYNIGRDELVGVMLDRSEEMIIAILGILKSGGAYVPIDPSYPEERKTYLLSDSRCKVVIDRAELGLIGDVYGQENPERVNTPTDLAYVIYTSGSTGQPKGVMVEHRNVVAVLENFKGTYFREGMAWGAVTNYVFDISVFELVGSLLSGMKLIILLPDDPRDTIKHIAAGEIDVLQLTPSRLNQLIQANDGDTRIFRWLRLLMVCGEALSQHEYTSLKGYAVPVLNGYGPTETTILSTYAHLQCTSVVTIGRPLLNEYIYILGDDSQLLPLGVTGEICIGGEGLARGYWGRPELTAERFVPNPFREGERMYRTGDTGRWLPDGNIEFIGRKDDQVKVRGYRIEPGEIEHALRGHTGVRSAAVVLWEQPAGEKELVAYVVGDASLNAVELRSYLGGLLPGYMIPGYYVALEELPLTASGKVDRKSFPDPVKFGLGRGMGNGVAQTQTELRLIGIWEEVLGREGIGIRDDFFESGGHSLKATRLASRLYKEFGVKVSLQELFSYPVLQEQGALLDRCRRTAYRPIENVAPQAGYGLSPAQQRLWIVSQLPEGSRAYHMSGVYRLKGQLQKEGLTYGFERLVGRHEVLRTVFREDEQGEVRQYVLGLEETGFRVGYHDELTDVELEQRIKEDRLQPFDLSQGPLVRVNVYPRGNREWILTYTMHHIIGDGWSMGVVMRELSRLYNAYVSGEAADLAPLRIHYKDYAGWQQEQRQGGSQEAHRQYWLHQLGGELPVLELSGDRWRPVMKTYNGGMVNGVIGVEMTDGLRKLCLQQKATLFMGLLALVKGLLYRYTGQEDIIIGSPVAGREHVDLEEQIGFYVNTLALRSRFNGRGSYWELLSVVKEVTMAAYEHQQYALDDVMNELGMQRDLSRSAVFDVMVILQNAEGGIKDVALKDVSISDEGGHDGLTSKYDLTFNFEEGVDGLQYSIEYNSDIYHRSTIIRMGEHLEHLLQSVLLSPDKSLSSLNYFCEGERQVLLETFNDTEWTYPRNKTLVDLFEARVRKHPEAIAVVYEGRTMTYEQLNRRSNQLAWYLRKEYNIGRDELVGVMLDRSEEMIIAILGILKSGGAYVPIDPSYPEERKTYLLSDSRCKVVIDRAELGLIGDVYGQENPASVNAPTDLAYVIYTSGSTGRPKGVMIEHRGIINRIEWMWNHYAYGSDDIILQKTTFTFDVSVWEILMPLCYGAKMVLCRNGASGSPEYICSLIEKEKITCLHFVPGMLQAFIHSSAATDIKDKLASLRLVITSGEALPVATVREWYNKTDIPIHNLYGPTEASVDVTYFPTSRNDDKILIGQPIWNTQIYILGDDSQLLPLGVTGEICIGGEGLARGYWGRPELTAERFVPNPFREGERMYRTGDTGRWLPDGNIEFIGRKDDQVKVRGYRIEPGEIEHALRGHTGVRSAAVVLWEQPAGEKELVAYVVGDASLNAVELRSYLGGLLPGYMIPGYYVALEELPLTASGKVDRKSFPDPVKFGLGRGMGNGVAQTQTELRLIGIWEEVLGREGIGIRDDFFESGGHSLKATRLASRLYKEFGVKVSLQELFSYPVLQEQGALLDRCRRTAYRPIENVAPQAGYGLSPAQQRLWIVSQLPEGSRAYHMSGVYRLKGQLQKEGLTYGFERLVGRHEVLRTVFREDEQGEVRQYVLGLEETGFRVGYHDELTDVELEQRIKEDRLQPFDLSQGPLVRVNVYPRGNREWILTYTMHHIIGDGWSMGVVMRELSRLYNAYVSGEAADLAPLRIHYKDYAGWQQEQRQGGSQEAHRQYWLHQLGGELPVLELSGDRWRPVMKTYNGGMVNGVIGVEMTDGLRKLCLQQKATLFMGLLALVKGLLYRYTGQEDIIIGSPVAGREHVDLEEQIGFYVNTLALRSRFNGRGSYWELLSVVKEVTMAAYEHQQYALDDVMNELGMQRDLSRSAVFDVMVILQNAEGGIKDVALKDVSISDEGGHDGLTSKYDLTFNFEEGVDGLQYSIEYNSDIYHRSTIIRMGEHLEHLLQSVLLSPDKSLSSLNYLSDKERRILRLI